MRSLSLIALATLPACFTNWTPDIGKQARTSSTEQASSSCDDQCKEDCDDINDRKAYDKCISVCTDVCVTDEASCPRPEPTPPPAPCKSCTPVPPKAAICEPCQKNEECAGTGSLCLGADAATSTAGHCGQKCTIDCDCPATYECRPVTDPKTGRFDAALGRQCVPASKQCPQCKADADCEAGNICEAGKCVAACADDSACAAGQRCFEDGRCAVACCEDKDCGDATLVCGDGRCVKK